MRLNHGTFCRRALAHGLALLGVASMGVIGSTVTSLTSLTSESTAVAARDPWQRPFASTSIWNMPIGSNARYVDAGLPAAANAAIDPVMLRRLSPSDPSRPLLTPGSWRNRCSGSSPTGTSLPIPDSFVVADAYQRPDGGWTTPNNVSAFLLPDGRTVLNTNAVARCRPGGPVFGYQTGDPKIDRTDLYGDGRLGSHGASRLSALGGAIRPGELTGEAPIQHALDVLVWGRYLKWDGDGYRWPAAAADAYASGAYTGSVPDMQMGSLLALRPDLTPESLGITTAVGRKLFAAMQDYGGYVTDDSAWDANYVSVDADAVGTFPWGPGEQADFTKIMDAVSVVANNAPDAIGGGGTPRRPLLPELAPAVAPPGTGLVTPSRLMDTRAGSSTADGQQRGGGALNAGATTVVQVAGRAGVPAGATAALLNLTVTQAGGDGFATVFPCGTTPTTSTVNFTRGQSVANAALVPLDGVGRACISTSARTDVVVDVAAWSGSDAALRSVAPTRLLDTRSKGLRDAGSVTKVRVTGQAGVPATGVGLVALNVTVTGAWRPGFATVVPCGATASTSSVNFEAMVSVANAVVVPPDANGDVCITADAPGHLVVDLTGWSPNGGRFRPVTPARLTDTRGSATVDGRGRGGGPVAAGGVVAVDVLARAGVPGANVSAVVLNVTSTASSADGFLTVFPCGGAVPLASTLNYRAGRSVAASAVVPLGGDGRVCVSASSPGQVVVDVTGFVTT